MLSDGLGIVGGIIVAVVAVWCARNRAGIRLKAWSVLEGQARRRGGAVSEAAIEKRVRAGVFAGWATAGFAVAVTVFLVGRLVIALV